MAGRGVIAGYLIMKGDRRRMNCMIKARFPGTYVEADVSGTAVRFFVNNPADVIQRHHMAGEFYEQEDLALIARHLRPDSRYLDVGANVGNHVIYLCRIAGLRQVEAGTTQIVIHGEHVSAAAAVGESVAEQRGIDP